MQLGIDTFVANRPTTTPVERVAQLMEEVTTADRVGLDVFAIGEHHRPDFISSSPATLLASAATVTKQITLSSAVTVLSSDDPVRVYQQFATVDLVSGGRAEIQVGRGSFTESYPLFGHDLNQYDQLFAERLDLLLNIRENEMVTWQGQTRSSLDGLGVYPRSLQPKLAVRLGVGGSPGSFVRAGRLGLPLTVAIIGGDPMRFRSLVDVYRKEYAAAGHDPAGCSVAVHSHGHISTDSAEDELWPSYEELMGRIGRERGWPPVTRHQFEAEVGPRGSLYVGTPEVVAGKIKRMSEALGGVDRVTLLMDGSLIKHEQILRSIELFGTEVRGLLDSAL
ncbi:MAG TPA: LLM class flavin-dependent oxidoreductase [Fimbriimonas sp.]|nr:LLM class flavin-dependent oxidoreductase [Fimbriimonas sp.]